MENSDKQIPTEKLPRNSHGGRLPHSHWEMRHSKLKTKPKFVVLIFDYGCTFKDHAKLVGARCKKKLNTSISLPWQIGSVPMQRFLQTMIPPTLLYCAPV